MPLRYMFLITGQQIKQLDEIEHDERVLILSASPIFQGIREKVHIVSPEEVLNDKMSTWSTRNADAKQNRTPKRPMTQGIRLRKRITKDVDTKNSANPTWLKIPDKLADRQPDRLGKRTFTVFPSKTN